MMARHRVGGVVAIVVVLLSIACAPPSKPKPNPQTELANKVRMAQGYFRAGRTTLALQAIEEAMELDPDNAGLHNFYGQILFVSGRNSEAESAYDKALNLDPYLTDAHNNLGALYAETGRPNEAETEYMEALKDSSYPTPQKVYLNLGSLYSSQGRDDEALPMLRRAVEIDPHYYRAHFELAGVLDRQGNLEEAARVYEVAKPEYRNSGEYHYRLGFVYFRLRNYPRATEELEAVLDIAPGSESAVRADELLKIMGES
jgi:type IV pilus biogenesis/stability protein PilW